MVSSEWAEVQRSVAGVARCAAAVQVGLHDRVHLLPPGRHLRLAGPEICSEKVPCVSEFV